MNRILFCFILLLVTFNSKAQDKELIEYNNPYYEIDSLAVYTEFKDDIPLLVSDITKNCTTQLEKTRAIFMWITENIAYDYKAVNRNKTTVKYPKHKRKKDYGAAYAKWEDKFLKKIIKKEKAVCFGYSMLFKKMCDLAGIQGSVINGYTKQKLREIGTTGALNHAWNVVLIEGKYYYFDVTWGAGYTHENKYGKLLDFKKKRKYFYWCMPYEKMLLDHFPSDPEWIRHIPYENAREEYKIQPDYSSFSKSYFKVVKPDSGIINAKVGDTIHFELEIQDNTPEIFEIVLEPNFKPDDNTIIYNKTRFKRTDSVISFDYPVTDKRIRELIIYLDRSYGFGFKIKAQ